MHRSPDENKSDRSALPHPAAMRITAATPGLPGP